MQFSRPIVALFLPFALLPSAQFHSSKQVAAAAATEIGQPTVGPQIGPILVKELRRSPSL